MSAIATPETSSAGHAMGAFDLVDQPWIRVRMLDGAIETLSLADTVRQAAEIRELAGDVGQQDFAVLRLLLAVSHAALRRVEIPGKPAERWQALWQSPGALGGLAVDYLREWSDRFDLFDRERPFLQVAGLTTGKDQIFPLERVILDVPNDVDKPYFTTRAGDGLRRMTCAEAARWLVTAQSTDVSGIKSGVLGDPRVKGGKGYPIGTAPAASIGGLVVEGTDLERTLLLNLVLGNPDNGHEFLPVDDAPVWESADPIGPGVQSTSRPSGPIALLTWPSRRLRLQVEDGRVVGCLLANGDPLDVAEVRGYEFMTAWRQPASDLASTGEPVLRPVRHDADRALWRGLASILPSPEGTQLVGGKERAVESAGTLRWLDHLRRVEVLERDALVTVRAYGLKLDANSAIVQDVVDDDVQLVIGLLDPEAADLVDSVTAAARDTETAVYALGRLRQRLADAAGNRDTDARGVATTAGFFAVDAPFRAWLRSIRPGDDPEAVRTTWHERARSILLDLGRRYVVEAPPSAIIGRTTSFGEMSTPIAERWFLTDLDAALSLTDAATARRAAQEERTSRATNRTDRTEAAT